MLSLLIENLVGQANQIVGGVGEAGTVRGFGEGQQSI
jgi:hypothetical protein